MTDLSNIRFGRIVPLPEKLAQNRLYSFSALGIPTAASVEIELPLPPGLVEKLNQGNTGACTGYSASWMTAINNYRERGRAINYDAMWLYRRGQATDGDPNTNSDDDGGYVWAVMDVLRKEGHKLRGAASPALEEGIESYYWCRSVDDIRTAFTLYRAPVFGINWHSSFMSPKLINGEYWIGTQSSWGSIVGGHAICARRASDQRQAVLLRNTWGADYPEVWISYTAITKLLAQAGECAVAIDRGSLPPPPADSIEITKLPIKDKFYSGILSRVV